MSNTGFHNNGFHNTITFGFTWDSQVIFVGTQHFYDWFLTLLLNAEKDPQPSLTSIAAQLFNVYMQPPPTTLVQHYVIY